MNALEKTFLILLICALLVAIIGLILGLYEEFNEFKSKTYKCECKCELTCNFLYEEKERLEKERLEKTYGYASASGKGYSVGGASRGFSYPSGQGNQGGESGEGEGEIGTLPSEEGPSYLP